jgi:hypothetical protein
MASNTNSAVSWDPAGAPAYRSDYQPGLNQYFEDLAHDSGGHENVDSVAAQYNDAAGEFAAYSSHFGGALIDADSYPANGCTEATICVTDSQIRTELTDYVSANHLPADLVHEYFVLTPPGVESCLEPGKCSAASCTPSPRSGTRPIAVSASLTSLTANTTYHFRAIATNWDGKCVEVAPSTDRYKDIGAGGITQGRKINRT